jgi:hypothetical protein
MPYLNLVDVPCHQLENCASTVWHHLWEIDHHQFLLSIIRDGEYTITTFRDSIQQCCRNVQQSRHGRFYEENDSHWRSEEIENVKNDERRKGEAKSVEASG